MLASLCHENKRILTQCLYNVETINARDSNYAPTYKHIYNICHLSRAIRTRAKLIEIP